MSSALNEVITFAREEMLVRELEAYTHIENTPSLRLLQQAGFKRNAEKEKEKCGITEPVTSAILDLAL
jgi:RimJ/RimL family protein N-acetyltransferase